MLRSWNHDPCPGDALPHRNPLQACQEPADHEQTAPTFGCSTISVDLANNRVTMPLNGSPQFLRRSGVHHALPVLKSCDLCRCCAASVVPPSVSDRTLDVGNVRLVPPGSDGISDRTGPSRGPSIIVVWLWGGPSHMETFDLKPDAPEEFRGTFRPIPTNVPGIAISEKLPLLARIADKYALIRSVAHDSPGHVNSTHTVLTGYTGELMETPPFAPKYPFVFNAAQQLLPSRLPGLPQWVALPSMRYEGEDTSVPRPDHFRSRRTRVRSDFRVAESLTQSRPRIRLNRRSQLLTALGRETSGDGRRRDRGCAWTPISSKPWTCWRRGGSRGIRPQSRGPQAPRSFRPQRGRPALLVGASPG